MSVWSEALTFPTTAWGGTLCADADMGQVVLLLEGKLAEEAVGFNTVPPL